MSFITSNLDVDKEILYMFGDLEFYHMFLTNTDIKNLILSDPRLKRKYVTFRIYYLNFLKRLNQLKTVDGDVQIIIYDRDIKYQYKSLLFIDDSLIRNISIVDYKIIYNTPIYHIIHSIQFILNLLGLNFNIANIGVNTIFNNINYKI
jgi:hypothetical protein